MKLIAIFGILFFVTVSHATTPEEKLGAKLFFDESLSTPSGKSCASCHSPERAFSEPDTSRPTSRGVFPDRFGDRNAPTLKYASFIPPFGKYPDLDGRLLIGGGLTADGHALSLEEQAKGPLLNPLEMANSDFETVVKNVLSKYRKDFEDLFGADELADSTRIYDRIVGLIASFERSSVFSPFDSKFDAYLDGKTNLSDQELRGLKLFEDPTKGNCVVCHLSRVDTSGRKPLFTNFSYENIGVPRNPENSFYQVNSVFNPDGGAYIDNGLANHTKNIYHRGGFRIPTLRNVALTSPYMHNGYFKTLRGAVEFYNSRDVLPPCVDSMTTESDAASLHCWPAPEVVNLIDPKKSGKLGLSSSEVDDIVAFLETLTDGWTP